MQTTVSAVLRSATRDRYEVEAALKYCKMFMLTLKGEERRKVHTWTYWVSLLMAQSWGYSCIPLAILMQYTGLWKKAFWSKPIPSNSRPGKANTQAVQPHRWADGHIHQACSSLGESLFIIDYIACRYTQYNQVSVQRKFIRESTDSLATDLHKKFAVWVNDRGLHSPTEDQWKSIMDEDSSRSLVYIIVQGYNYTSAAMWIMKLHAWMSLCIYYMLPCMKALIQLCILCRVQSSPTPKWRYNGHGGASVGEWFQCRSQWHWDQRSLSWWATAGGIYNSAIISQWHSVIDCIRHQEHF